MCSVLSNHHSPSHDIADSLANLERFKHQVSGGWWKNSVGDYVRAGEGVRTFLEHDHDLQRRLGWTERLSSRLVPGVSTLTSMAYMISAVG